MAFARWSTRRALADFSGLGSVKFTYVQIQSPQQSAAGPVKNADVVRLTAGSPPAERHSSQPHGPFPFPLGHCSGKRSPNEPSSMRVWIKQQSPAHSRSSIVSIDGGRVRICGLCKIGRRTDRLLPQRCVSSFEQLFYVCHRPKQLHGLFSKWQETLPLIEAAGAFILCIDNQCERGDLTLGGAVESIG